MKNLKTDSHSHGHNWGLRVGTEIVASTVIGLGMGYYIDKWLDTRPLFLLLFFLFGVIAGFLNLYRVVRLDQERMRKR